MLPIYRVQASLKKLVSSLGIEDIWQVIDSTIAVK
jgi:hypothetical protein